MDPEKPDSTPILSILICSLESRRELLHQLLASLYAQIKYLSNSGDVEVLYLIDSKEITVGEKRNKLLDLSKGKYVVFVDDDDRVSGDYISLILKAAESNPDAIGITGIITWDLKNPKMFRHSLDYGKECPTIDNVYNKPPYHVCPIRSTIAKSHRFPEISYGEDAQWAGSLYSEIKTCATIPIPIYFYDFRFSKSETQRKNIGPLTEAPKYKPVSKAIPSKAPMPRINKMRPPGIIARHRHFNNNVIKRS
jgi:glycosyltransferase involved in cell wall biosynthesis